ncbi:MAG: hypothetical protein ABIO55_07880 [Ginsengibacter sp.]
MARLLLLVFLFYMGCNSTETSVDKVSTDKKDTSYQNKNITETLVLLPGCYTWAVKRDTAAMKLDIAGNKVTGELRYNWYEKDRSVGTLKGIIKNDLIVAEYTFQSEGMTSVREVVFKIKDKSLVEGFGDYNTGSDTMRFKNAAQLKFQDDRVFNKIECNIQ